MTRVKNNWFAIVFGYFLPQAKLYAQKHFRRKCVAVGKR